MKQIKVNRKIDTHQQFKISRMKELIKPTKPHKHGGYHEVIFLTDGAGVHAIDDKEYIVEPPVMFFMNPGHVHCWEFSKIPKGFVCIFKEEFLDETPSIKRFFSCFKTMYKLKKEELNFITDFNLLFQEFKQDNPNDNILRSYLNAILWKITRLPTHEETVGAQHETILRFRDLIEDNYSKEKELRFYANSLNTTVRSLTSLCKKEIGRPASSLINERTVEESKRLLKHTSNSISQIAYHLNFNDPSHFLKFFKSKTNLTPTEFRDKL